MVNIQKLYRSLFAEYLSLISTILLMVPTNTSMNSITNETMKLLNEVFIDGDELWQESVKTYVISLFLADIASSISLDRLTYSTRDDNFSQQACILIEELRGVTLVNLDE